MPLVVRGGAADPGQVDAGRAGPRSRSRCPRRRSPDELLVESADPGPGGGRRWRRTGTRTAAGRLPGLPVAAGRARVGRGAAGDPAAARGRSRRVRAAAGRPPARTAASPRTPGPAPRRRYAADQIPGRAGSRRRGRSTGRHPAASAAAAPSVAGRRQREPVPAGRRSAITVIGPASRSPVASDGSSMATTTCWSTRALGTGRSAELPRQVAVATVGDGDESTVSSRRHRLVAATRVGQHSGGRAAPRPSFQRDHGLPSRPRRLVEQLPATPRTPASRPGPAPAASPATPSRPPSPAARRTGGPAAAAMPAGGRRRSRRSRSGRRG